MTPKSPHLTDTPVERFDSTTGELRNRGVAMDAPLGAQHRHAVRQRRDDEWDDYCFRANVAIHGYDKAKSLWDTVRAMEARV